MSNTFSKENYSLKCKLEFSFENIFVKSIDFCFSPMNVVHVHWNGIRKKLFYIFEKIFRELITLIYRVN